MSALQPEPSVDVAVVGGGVIGLCAAWRAAQRGLSVALIERDRPGAGASSVAAGMLAPVTEAEFADTGHRGLRLGLAAAELWPACAADLREATGTDVGLRSTGTLVVARDRDEAEALEREIAFRESLGLRTARLRASQARELEPALAPTVRLALEAPDDHSVDPRLVLAALAGAAAAHGARIVSGAEVTAVELDDAGERVTGVALADGRRVGAEQVVIAAGAWSPGVTGLPEAVSVPVRPVKGQILRLRDPAGPGLLTRVLRYEGGYVVPRGDGRYVLGATVEERGYDRTPTVGGVLEMLREARELLPGVTELVLEEVGVGLRPGSPDNLPFVGPGALSGLVWATGHHRNGILLAPLTGELVAATLTGEPPSELARDCDPGRLAGSGARA